MSTSTGNDVFRMFAFPEFVAAGQDQLGGTFGAAALNVEHLLSSDAYMEVGLSLLATRLIGASAAQEAEVLQDLARAVEAVSTATKVFFLCRLGSIPRRALGFSGGTVLAEIVLDDSGAIFVRTDVGPSVLPQMLAEHFHPESTDDFFCEVQTPAGDRGAAWGRGNIFTRATGSPSWSWQSDLVPDEATRWFIEELTEIRDENS